MEWKISSDKKDEHTDKIEESIKKYKYHRIKKRATEGKKRIPKGLLNKTTKKLKDVVFAKHFFEELAKLPEEVGAMKIPRPDQLKVDEDDPNEGARVHQELKDRKSSLFIIIAALLFWLLQEFNTHYWDQSKYEIKKLERLRRIINDIISDKTSDLTPLPYRLSVAWWMLTTPSLVETAQIFDFAKVFLNVIKKEQSISPYARTYLRSAFLELLEDDDIAYDLIKKDGISCLLNLMNHSKIDARYEEGEFEPLMIRTLLSTEERAFSFVSRGRQFTTELEYIISKIDKYPLTVAVFLAQLTSYSKIQSLYKPYEVEIMMDAAMILTKVKDDHVKAFGELCLENLYLLETKPISSVHTFNFEWKSPAPITYTLIPLYLWVRFRMYGSWKGLYTLTNSLQKSVLLSSTVRASFLGGLCLSIWASLKERKQDIQHFINTKLEDRTPSMWNDYLFRPAILQFSQPDNEIPTLFGVSSCFIRMALLYMAPFTLVPQLGTFGVMYLYSEFMKKVAMARKNVSNKLT